MINSKLEDWSMNKICPFYSSLFNRVSSSKNYVCNEGMKFMKFDYSSLILFTAVFSIEIILMIPPFPSQETFMKFED